MTVGRESEDVRTLDRDTALDAVTCSWGDRERGLFGLVRVGLSADGASALSVLFAGGAPVHVLAEGGVAVEAPSWSSLDVAGLRTAIVTPLERWTVALDGVLDLELTAVTAPAALDASAAAAKAGGMQGYEQLCRVRGTVWVDGAAVAVDALGQRGHWWGAPDWRKLAMTRSVSVWAGESDAVLLASVVPEKRRGHDEESRWGVLVDPSGLVEIDDPRLSTTYDGDGHQRRAGLELWVGEEDEFPIRAAGEVLCGSTLDLGSLVLECAFFRWRVEGREGVGRYDVLRKGAA